MPRKSTIMAATGAASTVTLTLIRDPDGLTTGYKLWLYSPADTAVGRDLPVYTATQRALTQNAQGQDVAVFDITCSDPALLGGVYAFRVRAAECGSIIYRKEEGIGMGIPPATAESCQPPAVPLAGHACRRQRRR